jgi:cytochrome c2
LIAAHIVILAGMLVFTAAFTAMPLAAQAGDAQAGAAALKERQCTVCHSVAGRGGSLAPDLARRSRGDFTPATLAAMMWNHGPAMWRAMDQLSLAVPALGSDEVLDLYAYFFWLRYFEPPGDAGRGRVVFVSKSCNQCHALVVTNGTGPGKPVPQWPAALTDPVLWIQNMWNHGGEMSRELQNKGIAWPRFTVQEMTDLMVYLLNLPGLPTRQPDLRFGQGASGEEVLRDKGCMDCHTFGASVRGRVDLFGVSRRERSLTGLAATMWNHRPIMAAAAERKGIPMKPFEGQQMAHLISYLFEENYFDEPGIAARGANLFQSKHCGACHGVAGTGAPALLGRGGGFMPANFGSAVWTHGPAMLKTFQERGINWPNLTGRDVSDIIAYLNGP